MKKYGGDPDDGTSRNMTAKQRVGHTSGGREASMTGESLLGRVLLSATAFHGRGRLDRHDWVVRSNQAALPEQIESVSDVWRVSVTHDELIQC
jgi:hypothetical protein